jgi:FAD synthase
MDRDRVSHPTFAVQKYLTDLVAIDAVPLTLHHFRVAVLGYLRPERNFESLQDLIKAIENDIKQSEEKLSDPAVEKFKRDKFFSS